MAVSGGNVWCGCDGGDICVFSCESGALVKHLRKVHDDTVDTLVAVGNQVRWTGYGGRGGIW